ncbi:MAG: hypothetical protein QOK22_551 [Gaiellaceae bacterium]|jgi:hypothetical protein|nr:hypothetical protein [Gaiellaceae bacterium]
MSEILIHASLPSDARWAYDDPSGLPETTLSVPLPEPLRGRVEWAAAREGMTPSAWLLALVARGLPSLSTPKAV